MSGQGIAEGVVFVLAGAYIAIVGITAHTLIAEEPPPTAQERSNAKATPRVRFLCIAVGLCSIIYGLVLVSRST
jgi:hypothetical protein